MATKSPKRAAETNKSRTKNILTSGKRKSPPIHHVRTGKHVCLQQSLQQARAYQSRKSVECGEIFPHTFASLYNLHLSQIGAVAVKIWAALVGPKTMLSTSALEAREFWGTLGLTSRLV